MFELGGLPLALRLSEKLGRNRSTIDEVKLCLPPRNCLSQQLALLASREWPGIDGVVVDVRARWVHLLLASAEIDLYAAELNGDTLPCSGLVLLEDRVPLVVNEGPEDFRRRLRGLHRLPPVIDGVPEAWLSRSINVVQHMPDSAKKNYACDPLDPPLPTLDAIDEFAERGAAVFQGLACCDSHGFAA